MICRVLTITLLSLCLSVGADDRTVSTAVNLDGYQYMAFLKIGDEGPDPHGLLTIPLYTHLAQEGGSVYGTIVLPRFLVAEDTNPSSLSLLGFDSVTLYDGYYKGKKLFFKFLDSDNEEYDYTAKVLKGGELLKLIVPVGSGKYVIRMQRVNSGGEYWSGMYLGTVSFPAQPSQMKDNVLLGVSVLGEKIYICPLLMTGTGEEDISGGVVLEGSFDPTTGSFNIAASGENPGITGAIADGRLTFTATFPEGSSPLPTQNQVSGTLYFFGDTKGKKPLAKKIKPKKVAAGGERTVAVYCYNVFPGCVARLVTVGGKVPGENLVSIRRYLYKLKYVEVVLNVAAGAGGSYKIKITNPNGKEATSKRAFKIK